MIDAYLVAEGVGAALALAVVLVRLLVAFPIRVSGHSMEPTLHDGDFLLVRRTRRYRRRDIVICHYPGRWHGKAHILRENFVKRIIGLPGETVEIVDGTVFVGGSPLRERYAAASEGKRPINMRARRLGPDEYFVMGDNRYNSNDSRRIGPIGGKMLVGRVTRVLYPEGHSRRLD